MFQWRVSQGFVKQHCTGEHCTRLHFSGLLASPTPPRPPQQTLCYYSCHLLTCPPHNRPCVTTHAIFSPPPPPPPPQQTLCNYSCHLSHPQPPQQTLCYYSCHLLTPPPPPTTDPVQLLMPSSHPHPHNRPCATTRALFSPFSSSRSTMCPWPWAEAMCSAVRPWGVQAFTSAPVTWDSVWKTRRLKAKPGLIFSHCLWKHMYMRCAFSWQWLQHTQDQWLKFTTRTLTLNNACTGSNMPSPLPYWLQVISLAVKGLDL